MFIVEFNINMFLFSSANSVTCQNSAGNTGDYLYLEVTASYPSGCTSSGCHNKYDKQLTQLFSVTHTQFTLSITLSNGTTLNIVLNFCSLNQFIGITTVLLL